MIKNKFFNWVLNPFATQSNIQIPYAIEETKINKKIMEKATQISMKGIQLIEQFECSGDVTKFLNAYKCPAGVWTIGIGTTVYPNGEKVKPGDVCTKEQAYMYLRYDLTNTEKHVDSYTTDAINQYQFDALVSFAYNCGTGALKDSTLLKKVNINVNDPTIRDEFNKWVHGGGKKLPGLVARRKAEADLYFTKME